MLRSATPFISPAPARSYLWIGFGISLFLHAGAIAWKFSPIPQRLSFDPLEVAIVSVRTETAPIQPQVRAPVQLDGGGKNQAGMVSSPFSNDRTSTEFVKLQILQARQHQMELEQQQLLTQLQSRVNTATASKIVAGPSQTNEITDSAESEQEDGQITSLAILSERVQQYNKRPRKRFIAPSAAQSRYAAYIDQWRQRIETIGTRYYPDEARGHTYGSLRVTVYIRADGSVTEVEIDQPSKHAILNQAVKRIVQLAAPFAPFPAELARNTDILALTRTWHFIKEKLETQHP